jgi:formylglycine-generating enzyme required for sulfatase activity
MSATPCERWLRAAWLLLVALACKETAPTAATASTAPAAAPPPWDATARAPTPPRGMIWVPDGALVAGTPAGRQPRLADQEMAGEQLVLHGYFMDVFEYPNEEGAIPRTGVTQAQAEALCAEQDKRLCTELEWERACKGPENATYEYGDRYRADVCLTGRAPRMLPSGFRTGCRSEFGARDLHGGVWEWTASRWGRGGDPALVVLRGGNGDAGDVIGRCANALARAPSKASSQIGFRCCTGEPNDAVVSVTLERGGRTIDRRERLDKYLTDKLESLVPEDVRAALVGVGTWEVEALWDWRPNHNARFVAAGGCAGSGLARRCGALVSEMVAGQPQPMAWVWSGIWPPNARLKADPRLLWIYGGDRRSPIRQPAIFEWGRLRVGELERRFNDAGEWKRASGSPPQQPRDPV